MHTYIPESIQGQGMVCFTVWTEGHDDATHIILHAHVAHEWVSLW